MIIRFLQMSSAWNSVPVSTELILSYDAGSIFRFALVTVLAALVESGTRLSKLALVDYTLAELN